MSAYNFRSLDELILALSREKALLKEMFAKRKALSFRRELALELVENRPERLQHLINYGIVRDNGTFLDLEETYLRFFEEVLKVNEEINVESVRTNIEHLNETIEYYLQETNENQKYGYSREVCRSLNNIANNTKRNVIDLKRNVDNTYKNEPNYQIKKSKLKHLDEKRDGIRLMIREAEKVLDEQSAFFKVAMDYDMRNVVDSLRSDLNESSHNLIEIEKQIIEYLNLIDRQSEVLKKIKKIKYLRDQQILETNTDVRSRLNEWNPVWMEPEARSGIKISLDFLRNTDAGLDILREVRSRKNRAVKILPKMAEPLSPEDLNAQSFELQVVNQTEMKNAFVASSQDLFQFVMNFYYPFEMDLEAKLVLFCQMATQFYDEFNLTDRYAESFGYEYPLIYAR